MENNNQNFNFVEYLASDERNMQQFLINFINDKYSLDYVKNLFKSGNSNCLTIIRDYYLKQGVLFVTDFFKNNLFKDKLPKLKVMIEKLNSLVDITNKVIETKENETQKEDKCI